MFRTLISAILLAVSPGCSTKYSYDLIRIRQIPAFRDTGPADARLPTTPLRVELLATPRKTLFGAVVRNGSPYRSNVCIDAANAATTTLVALKVLRMNDNSTPVEIETVVNVRRSWNAHGTIACMDNVATFEQAIESRTVVCLDFFLALSGAELKQRTCFEFIRDVGEGRMTLKDIFNQ